VNKSSALYRNLRHFRLQSLLLRIGDASREMLKRKEPILSVPVERRRDVIRQTGNVTLSAWSLCDLAYFAIYVTNDFRGSDPSVHNLVSLCNDYLQYDNDFSRQKLDEQDARYLKLQILIGLSQKQFWYQEPSRIREEFNRQVQILERISERCNLKSKLDQITSLRVGLPVSDLRAVLFALFAVNMHSSDLTAIILKQPLDHIHPALTSANLNSIASHYAADYCEYRSSSLQENYFHVKPIVRTTKNRLVVPDAFMLCKKMADGPLWIIRDYYKDAGSHAFVNLFGNLFEVYMKDLLSACVDPSNYSRVPKPQSGKFADWFVTSPHFRLIVEQKAAMATMMMKKQYPELDDVNVLIKRLSKGLVQLDETEERHPDNERETVKFLVHYDTFFVSDGILRPEAIALKQNELRSTRNLFFCDIGEFEWLMSVLASSVDSFENIIRAKIDKQDSAAEGIELSQIIPKHSPIGNTYNHQNLNHWETFLPNLRQPDEKSSITT